MNNTIDYSVNLYDLARRKIHTTDFNGSHIQSIPMPDDVAEVVQTPLIFLSQPEPIYYNRSPIPTYYTLTYENSFPGVVVQYRHSITPMSTIADLLNGWNIHVSQGTSWLRMQPTTDPTDPTDPTHIVLSNTSPVSTHLFADMYGYIGHWAPYEDKVISIAEFMNVQIIQIQTHSSSVILKSPILVMQDRPVFNLTAYIYKKPHKNQETPTATPEFYMLNETVILQAGFYNTLSDLVAFINKNIKMRGERNGYIYHFVLGKSGKIGIEAAHRQPEPSFMLIEPLSFSGVLGVLGTPEGERESNTLHLRTSKRWMFDHPVAKVIM